MTGRRSRASTLGDVALRVTTPLGVARATSFASRRRRAIVVVPSLTNVRRFRLLAMQHRLSEAGVRALKQRGEGSAFAGLRDYVPGDDPRMLDWKATARHGRLITREQTVERSQTVITLIDCGRAMTQLAGAFSRFEHVLSSALLLSDVAATGGDRVGLIAFDDQIRAFVPPQRGTQALRALRTTMSGLDATLTEPDYASAFRLLATRQRRRALIVFFTDVIDERAARQFVAYAGRAALRHAVVVVAMQNEALHRRGAPSDERIARALSQRGGGGVGARARRGAGAHAPRGHHGARRRAVAHGGGGGEPLPRDQGARTALRRRRPRDGRRVERQDVGRRRVARPALGAGRRRRADRRPSATAVSARRRA